MNERVDHSLRWTNSDTIAEVLSANSCNIVLDTSPPQYVEKVSRYLALSIGQNAQNTVSCTPTKADSDSGDSLFITQKPPQHVRSSTSHYNLGSDHTPLRDLAEGGDDASSSASDEASKTDKRKKKYKLPLFSFSFLAERKSRPRSKRTQSYHSKYLHNYAMGGFFKCVQKMWQGFERGDEVDSSLLTVDMDPVSPLSEEEEEWSANEDIRVVEKKAFAVPLKRKSQQTWCQQVAQKKQRNATNTRQEPSQGKQCKTSRKVAAKATSSGSTSESASRVEAKKDEPAPGAGDSLNQAETHKTEGLLVREKKKKKAKEGKTWSESEATAPVTEAPVTEAPVTEAPATEAATEVLHIDDLPQTAQFERLHGSAGLTSDTRADSLCDETMVKKRKKKKKDKDRSRSEEEAQGTTSMNVTESPLNEGSMQGHEGSDTPDWKEKKKRKKREAAAENVNKSESDLLSFSTENGGKKKKKSKRSEKDEEQLQSGAASEAFNDNVETQKKHKKRKREEGIIVAEEGNDLAASQEILESSFVKRKKHKKKKHSSSKEASQQGGECVDSSVNDAAETVETSPKKTKKKKTSIEGVDNSFIPEEKKNVVDEDGVLKTEESIGDQNAEVRVRKKKKKKRSEDNTVQNDDLVSVKEKSSSFLCADSESSPSLEAYVWAGNLETESEELSGHLEKLNKEDRKKKKKKGKRKMLEVENGVGIDPEQDFEKVPNTTCQRSSCGITDTGGERRQTGNEAELMTPVESLESWPDAPPSSTGEAAALKKKRKKKRREDATSHVMHESPTEETESAISETPIDVSEKKKKKRVKHTDKVSFGVKSVTESVHLEPQDEKERTMQSAKHNVTHSGQVPSETCFLKPQMSLNGLTERKHTKLKKKLLNPEEDFLTDF